MRRIAHRAEAHVLTTQVNGVVKSQSFWMGQSIKCVNYIEKFSVSHMKKVMCLPCINFNTLFAHSNFQTHIKTFSR